MKKYIIPCAKVVALSEESELMLQTGSKYATDQYSNQKIAFDEEDNLYDWDEE